MTLPAFVHGTSCVGEPPARPYKTPSWTHRSTPRPTRGVDSQPNESGCAEARYSQAQRQSGFARSAGLAVHLMSGAAMALALPRPRRSSPLLAAHRHRGAVVSVEYATSTRTRRIALGEPDRSCAWRAVLRAARRTVSVLSCAAHVQQGGVPRPLPELRCRAVLLRLSFGGPVCTEEGEPATSLAVARSPCARTERLQDSARRSRGKVPQRPGCRRVPSTRC